MAENTKNVEFKNPHPELPVREPILKLGKMITDRAAIKLGLEKLTADDPEYWGLAAICTDEMAEVALKMGVRKPKTLPELVKITGMDEKYLEELLNKMAFNGVIEYNWENPKHEKQYVLPMFVPGSAEFANMNDTVLEEHPEMGRFFERMDLHIWFHQEVPESVCMSFLYRRKLICVMKPSRLRRFHTGLINTRANMQQAHVHAVNQERHLTRDVQMILLTGVLL